MKWINALGLLLQFLAFWFAAPELIGEQNLKRLKKGLIKFISAIPLILVTVLIIGYGGYFTIAGFMKGLQAAQSGIEKSEMIYFFILMGVCTVLYMLVMINYRKISKWLDERLARPLAHRLITNNQFRSTLLVVGAILFTVGFILQFSVLLAQ